jgi:hypothetical protein
MKFFSPNGPWCLPPVSSHEHRSAETFAQVLDIPTYIKHICTPNNAYMCEFALPRQWRPT